MWAVAIPFVTKIAGKVIEKVLKDRVSPEILSSVREALPGIVERDEEVARDTEEWLSFNREFFGTLEQLPAIAQIVRAMVRPAISLSLTVAVIWGAVAGHIEFRDLVLLLGPVVGFYFGERSALKRPGG